MPPCVFFFRGERPVFGLIPSLSFLMTYGRVPLRDRYWRRADGRLRMRYTLVGYMMVSALTSFSLMAGTPMVLDRAEKIRDSVTQMAAISVPLPQETPAQVAAATRAVPTDSLSAYRDSQGQIRRDPAATRTSADLMEQAERAPLAPEPHARRLTIAAGDTLSGLLTQAGLNDDDAGAALKVIRAHVRPSDLRPGQTLDLEMAPTENGFGFNRLTLGLDPVRTVEVKRSFAGFMSARMIEKPLKHDVMANVAIIKGSLYGAAEAAGVPTQITAEVIKALGHQIDFQRDLHPNDKLEIMYDRMVTEDGYVARPGKLLYARLYADGRELNMYRYEDNDGHVDYFNEKGHSIRKALLRTPLDGARVTSGFGMRMHPLLGYSKMHKGVDFGASTGTPIYASGDAVVAKAGRFGAYGNYIRLRHNKTLETAYAHLSRYAAGIRPGAKVRQGQIIGYVGTTGRSTGPHLHYEVMLSGAQVNPQSVKMPTMTILGGKDLKKFKATVDRLHRDFKDRVHGMRYASATPQDQKDLIVQ